LKSFKEVKINKPVIFITAYNEYALDAFKVNGIDYLLKPITFTDLSNSLKKVESLGTQLRWGDDRTETVLHALNAPERAVQKQVYGKAGRSHQIHYGRSDQFIFC
jgi:two-component system LytT family response regulator